MQPNREYRSTLGRLLRRSFQFIAVGLVLSSFLAAASSSDPEQYCRFDLTPLIGYRSIVSFAVDPHVQGTEPRLTLRDSASYGVAFGVRITPDDIIEFRWARQRTSVRLENQDVAVSYSARTYLDQFHGDFTHEYVLQEWREWAKPFIIGSVGATRISVYGNTAITRFSFGLGGGAKLMPSRHLGLRLQAQWLPIVVDPHATVFCGTGCVAHIGGTLNSQFEFAVGPIFRF